MKVIASRDNPGFKALKALARDARAQRRQGLALLDGVHLVDAYRQKVGLPRRLLISETGGGHAEIQTLCAQLAEVEVWRLRDELFAQLTETVTPVGILAVIEVPKPADIRPDCSCVLLDGVQDAGNVGSILRSAAACGCKQVMLGAGCAGAWTPRVLRAAQGAHFDLVIREQVDLAAIVAERGAATVAATARRAESLYDLDLTGPTLWLFGSEGRGIDPVLEAMAGRRARIPLAPDSESLNVAAAAAVCLFESLRQQRAGSASALRPGTSEVNDN